MNSTKTFILYVAVLIFGGGCNNSSDPNNAPPSPQKKLFWGDLHNHNAVGYGKGSLDRSFRIAESHLDFFCFTPHTQWPDLPVMPQNAHMKWVNGFQVAKDNWDSVKQYVKEYYKPGSFVTFPGYEWHSNICGDVCIIFPNDNADLLYFDDVESIQHYAKQNAAVLIPHHPAYKSGWRGQDWNVLDTEVTPVVEIYSEHGNAESDRSSIRYIRHSMGGRFTPNTIHSLWEKGIKVGVVASTDDHLGYPGAYGEGLVAVYADTLTRESVMEAVKSRRTYGVSADRIELDFQLNGLYMGENVDQTDNRRIFVKVKGKDAVDRVEILKNNRVVHRDHPIDVMPGENRWQKPVLCRIEFGWGPWGDLNMAKTCDWQFKINVTDGKIISATPCFQSGPFDESRFNEMNHEGNTCEVTSYTSRLQAFAELATNSVILEIQGSPETEISIALDKPQPLVVKKTLSDLEKSNDVLFTGPFTKESMMIHRLVFHDNYCTEFDFVDQVPEKTNDWYYVKVTQTNGSLAWSSPVWVGE